MRPLLILALLLHATPAPAQALRSLVVPPDAQVSVAPRGQPLPAPPAAPATLAPAPLAAAPLAAPTMGLGLGFGVLLPLAATAVLGGVLPGSGGSGGAPASTR